MTMTSEPETAATNFTRFEPETPFAETAVQSEASRDEQGFMPWTESFSPFAEAFGEAQGMESEDEAVIAEAFAELRDEAFDETLAELISETSEAADQRFAGETGTQFAAERERLAEAHLAPIGFEAERALDRMIQGLAGSDLESLSPTQLDEVLARFDPAPAGVSVAGEEFIGGLIRKAKSVVKTVVNVAGKVAKAALPILGPILNKLKALVRPLLKRVLAMAINRLPAALHGPARALARRFGIGEAEAMFEQESEQLASAVAVGDPESLAESFDAALAEAVLGGEVLEQGESFGHFHEDEAPAGTQLDSLAGAREAFMRQVQQASDGEDLAPQIEQFIPAILPALRLGIKLVGRPKVVGFLAGFLAKLIRQWVGPNMAKPLSNAIVDIGLRLVGLEQGQPGELEAEAGPAVLAATVEDTVRRLSEQPEHLFEDEDLLQLAVTEAFEQAVAANFPSQLVRPDLQVAPTLGGAFITRHARRPFAYKKYSRTPEVEVTEPIAANIATFGGVTLAASLKAAGRKVPMRVRVHIYEATAGTTLPRLARLEHVPGLGRNVRRPWRHLHPLTSAAAGLLLREPRLGTTVPEAFLRSRHKISVGQRFYYLEPLNGVAADAVAGGAGVGAGNAACENGPTRGRMKVDLAKSEVVISLYFSEADAQGLAAPLNTGAGGQALLKAFLAAFDTTCRALGTSSDSARVVGQRFEQEDLAAPNGAGMRLSPLVAGMLRQKLREWFARAMADWVRARSAEFAAAVRDPACGVTVKVRLQGVPGLPAVKAAMAGGGGPLRATAFQGAPSAVVTVKAGRGRA